MCAPLSDIKSAKKILCGKYYFEPWTILEIGYQPAAGIEMGINQVQKSWPETSRTLSKCFYTASLYLNDTASTLNQLIKSLKEQLNEISTSNESSASEIESFMTSLEEAVSTVKNSERENEKYFVAVMEPFLESYKKVLNTDDSTSQEELDLTVIEKSSGYSNEWQPESYSDSEQIESSSNSHRMQRDEDYEPRLIEGFEDDSSSSLEDISSDMKTKLEKLKQGLNTGTLSDDELDDEVSSRDKHEPLPKK